MTKKALVVHFLSTDSQEVCIW